VVAGYFSAAQRISKRFRQFVFNAATIIESFATEQKEGDRSECNFMLITKNAGFRMEKSMLIHPGHGGLDLPKRCAGSVFVHPSRALIAAKVRILPATVYETVAVSLIDDNRSRATVLKTVKSCRHLPTKNVSE